MSNQGGQGVGDGPPGLFIMPGQMASGSDNILLGSLDPLPSVTAGAQGCHGCRHAVPVHSLLDIEPSLKKPEDSFGMMGKLPGLGVLCVANNGEGLSGEPLLGLLLLSASFTLLMISSYGISK